MSCSLIANTVLDRKKKKDMRITAREKGFLEGRNTGKEGDWNMAIERRHIPPFFSLHKNSGG